MSCTPKVQVKKQDPFGIIPLKGDCTFVGTTVQDPFLPWESYYAQRYYNQQIFDTLAAHKLQHQTCRKVVYYFHFGYSWMNMPTRIGNGDLNIFLKTVQKKKFKIEVNRQVTPSYSPFYESGSEGSFEYNEFRNYVYSLSRTVEISRTDTFTLDRISMVTSELATLALKNGGWLESWQPL